MASIATRDAYGEALAELGAVNENIVVLEADLSKSTKTCDFRKLGYIILLIALKLVESTSLVLAKIFAL